MDGTGKLWLIDIARGLRTEGDTERKERLVDGLIDILSGDGPQLPLLGKKWEEPSGFPLLSRNRWSLLYKGPDLQFNRQSADRTLKVVGESALDLTLASGNSWINKYMQRVSLGYLARERIRNYNWWPEFYGIVAVFRTRNAKLLIKQKKQELIKDMSDKIARKFRFYTAKEQILQRLNHTGIFRHFLTNQISILNQKAAQEEMQRKANERVQCLNRASTIFRTLIADLKRKDEERRLKLEADCQDLNYLFSILMCKRGFRPLLLNNQPAKIVARYRTCIAKSVVYKKNTWKRFLIMLRRYVIRCKCRPL